MSLIKCPECGKEISDAAESCPNCGKPIKQVQHNTNDTVNIVPKKKRGKGCLIAIIVFVLVIIGIASVASRQSGKKKSSDDNQITFGEAGDISEELTLVVNGVTETDNILTANGLLSYKPDSGKYAVVNVTISNVSKKSQSLLLNYFKLIGTDDAEYVSTIIAVGDDKYITVDTINPNLDITGNLVFEIPQDVSAQDFLLQYQDYDFNNGKTFFKMK